MRIYRENLVYNDTSHVQDTNPSRIENSKCDLNLDFSQLVVPKEDNYFREGYQSKSENFGFNKHNDDQTDDMIEQNFNYGTPGTSPREGSV